MDRHYGVLLLGARHSATVTPPIQAGFLRATIETILKAKNEFPALVDVWIAISRTGDPTFARWIEEQDNAYEQCGGARLFLGHAPSKGDQPSFMTQALRDLMFRQWGITHVMVLSPDAAARVGPRVLYQADREFDRGAEVCAFGDPLQATVSADGVGRRMCMIWSRHALQRAGWFEQHDLEELWAATSASAYSVPMAL